MRTTFLSLAFLASLAIAGLSSCEKPSPDKPTDDNSGNGNNSGSRYTLIATPSSLSFGWNTTTQQTITVATNAPDGFALGECPTWITAEVTGMKINVSVSENTGDQRSHKLEIKAEGAESAFVTITQDKKGEVHPSLTGQKYIVWQIDGTSEKLIEGKIILRLSENQTNTHFMIWPDGTSLLGDDQATGANFYGNQAGFMALKVGNIGWSGAGYTASPEEGSDEDFLAPIWKQITDDNGEGWFFHAAVKGTPNVGTNFGICDKVESNGYSVKWDDHNVNESEWTEIEIPMTELVKKGWTGAPINTNNLTVSSGSQAGAKVYYDALFIYKK